MKADLFEIGELIDEANQCECEFELDSAINQIIGMYEVSNDLNDPTFKRCLDRLEKVWNKRKQFDKLRVRLNTIY